MAKFDFFIIPKPIKVNHHKGTPVSLKGAVCLAWIDNTHTVSAAHIRNLCNTIRKCSKGSNSLHRLPLCWCCLCSLSVTWWTAAKHCNWEQPNFLPWGNESFLRKEITHSKWLVTKSSNLTWEGSLGVQLIYSLAPALLWLSRISLGSSLFISH